MCIRTASCFLTTAPIIRLHWFHSRVLFIACLHFPVCVWLDMNKFPRSCTVVDASVHTALEMSSFTVSINTMWKIQGENNKVTVQNGKWNIQANEIKRCMHSSTGWHPRGRHHMPPTSCSSATDLFSQRSQISFIVTGKAWYDTVALWRPCTFKNVYYGPWWWLLCTHLHQVPSWQ